MFLFHQTSYLNEEVNCTKPSPSVSAPCLDNIWVCLIKKSMGVAKGGWHGKVACLWTSLPNTPYLMLHRGSLTRWRGMLSRVGYLILTSLDQLLLNLKILLTFSVTSYLNEEVNCTDPSPSISASLAMLINFIGLDSWTCKTKRLRR